MNERGASLALSSQILMGPDWAATLMWSWCRPAEHMARQGCAHGHPDVSMKRQHCMGCRMCREL